MNWKPHTEHPDRAGETVLIAGSDDEGGYLILAEIYAWDGSEFISEEDDLPINRRVPFWWILETDVLEGLPA